MASTAAAAAATRPALALARARAGVAVSGRSSGGSSGSGSSGSGSSSRCCMHSSASSSAPSSSSSSSSSSTSYSSSATSASASASASARRWVSHSAPSQRPALAHASGSSAPASAPPSGQPRPHRRSAAAPAFRGPAALAPSDRVLTPIPDLPSLRAWFADRFPSIALPDNVLLQAITHESHNQGRNIYSNHSLPQQQQQIAATADILSAGAHNRRLAFLGRRALTAYLALFLHSLSASTASHADDARRAADQLLRSPVALDVILHTGRLGDRPGRALQLEQVMRWTNAHESESRAQQHERGLFTIRGRTLEALVGAIYHQHGANLASQFFHARILPHIDSFPPSTPHALWDAIKLRAEEDSKALDQLRDWARGKRAELGYDS